MSTLAIAVIENLDGPDSGFGWGRDRRHTLVRCDCDLLQQVENLVETDDAPNDVLSAIADYIKATLHLSDQDIAVVDTEEGVTDEWPTTGQADSWSDDVWLGLADYLSFRSWCQLIGTPVGDYTLDAETADSCVANSGHDAVEDAMEYLTASDEIYATLRTALEKAKVES